MTLESKFPTAIDNSMRKELVKCETAAKYKYELGLRSNEKANVDLHAGKAFASGLETARRAFYVDGVEPGTAVGLGIEAVYKAYGSFIPPDKSNKTAARMGGALVFYFNERPLEKEKLRPIKFPNGAGSTADGGVMGIEVGFNFPIGIMHPTVAHQELSYCGRFDMLAQDENGDAWVVDEKTTSQMGDKWANQWLLDSQMTGYCWGAQKLLDQHGMNHVLVKGAVINGIAIRLRDYEHIRLNTYRQQWEIDRWYHQMKSNVLRWVDVHVLKTHDMALDHACATYNNPCEFSPLCSSRNPERIMDSSYTVIRWNPLTREET